LNSFAPVLICTMNRYKHFKRCVESLAACTHADKTDIFIGLDYPLNETHWEGYKRIKAYLPNIKGFKNVDIVERDRNYGVNENWPNMYDYVFERYDRVIVSEDDNIFAPSFLEFVNKGLCIYQNRNDIFTVTGFNSPFPMPSWYTQDVYLRTGFCGWGVGMWKDKWRKVDWSLDSFNSMLNKKENYQKLKKYYRRYLPDLLKIRDTGVITGDGLVFLHMLHHNMYSVYPVKSRVRNTGHDGSGGNCGHNEKYSNQKIYEGLDDICFPPDLQPDEKLTSYILKQIQISFAQKIIESIPAPIKTMIKKMVRVLKNISG
jgi:hypothetical protein